MKKYLITSIGRTGTKSLTNYLNQIPGVTCFHHKKERRDLPFLFLSQRKEFSNVNRAYLEEVDASAKKFGGEFYIEVNPYLRFADAGVLKELEWEKLFLVRDMKTYLESVYIRELFSEDDYLLNQIPDDSDPISSKWGSLTRFEKLCWYYYKVHSYILDSGISFYRFEEISENPLALKQLVSDIGIDTSKVKCFDLPVMNTSFKYKFQNKIKATLRGKTRTIEVLNWENLSKSELQFFQTYNDELAKRLGYVL